MIIVVRVSAGVRTGAAGCSPDYVSLQPATAADSLLADERFDSTAMFHYCSPRPIEDCLIVSRPKHCSLRCGFTFAQVVGGYDAIITGGKLSLAFLRVTKSSTSFGWGKGGNVTSAGLQVTLCDPIWHVSSRSGEAFARTAIHDFTFTFLLR